MATLPKMLLAAGAKINHKDKKKMTALKIAQQFESESYEKYLLKQGAK